MASSTTKSAVTMSLMTVLSRITGLFRWSAIGAALGLSVSNVADAYNLAYVMPNMVYELILGGILTSVFIPVFVEYKTKQSPEAAWEVANKVLTLAIVLLVSMTLFCWAFTPFLVKIQTFAGQEGLRKQAEFFFYFFAPTIIFFGLSAIFGGMLNTYKLFFIPAFTPILNNVILIGTAILYYFYPKQVGLGGLALGTTVGVAVMAFAQIPALYKLGWRFKWELDFKDPAFKKFITLATPMFLYVGLNQVALTIRNNFAASIQGGVAAMQYGFTFFQLPYGIFAVSITTVLYPTLSQHAVQKDWDKFRENVSQGIRWSLFIIIPCAIGYFFLSEPIIRLVMERGRFHSGDTHLLATVLSCYSLALLPYTLTLLFTRSFYALQDTRTPTIVILMGVFLTAAGCYALVGKYGVPGISLAYGIQYYGMAIFLAYLLRKKIRRLDGRRIGISVIKSSIASTVMGVVVYYLARYLFQLNGLPFIQHKFLSDLISLGISILVGGVVYLGMVSVLKMDEFYSLKNWIFYKTKPV
jgi:putative peptidoglycan lipid II flippase